MTKDNTIILTGAAGFIGSCMAQHLNDNGYTNLILVDDFGHESKRKNWENKERVACIERKELKDFLAQTTLSVDLIIHLGARTDTTEFDYSIHQELNVDYSKFIWNFCAEKQIPLIYASSAATYGDGELGYNDDHEVVEELKPLNPYGISKNEFDKWALKQPSGPTFWTGLKFFNIYGPNEYHKGRMASVIWHSFNQINDSGLVKLFKSHKEGYADGEQLRDFVYVKDLLKVILWMTNEMLAENWSIDNNGLYNLGTGKARSFEDLVKATFKGLGIEPKIEFIDMPIDIRDKYQYFTEANMKKLHSVGYNEDFYTLESGVYDYVKNYLIDNIYY
ncbi:ADP-glyceromanno-heptose 6-epimerase [Pedobacter petrophilus]|uniref:ADP-L-glycero-D-manno-heptose-6-epimerase n=1 Tax=Pedobacter petrophilus TaxID=1908241 RepID=A0A7K0G3B9_9SPHI|nr:ADP-glyceromanno-heptose 6-epimerase [Pedobacter petrophilus]MRX78201.1 ADP-glyceromanno-heptose 6-epimerase [Pedobacter petrophilus]